VEEIGNLTDRYERERKKIKFLSSRQLSGGRLCGSLMNRYESFYARKYFFVIFLIFHFVVRQYKLPIRVCFESKDFLFMFLRRKLRELSTGYDAVVMSSFDAVFCIDWSSKVDCNKSLSGVDTPGTDCRCLLRFFLWVQDTVGGKHHSQPSPF
jgi:hypothetical protein